MKNLLRFIMPISMAVLCGMQSLFGISPNLKINKVNTAPEIDGDGTDLIWSLQSENKLLKSAGSTIGLSASFKMCYDFDNLYILIKVTDPTPNQNGGVNWQCDGVDIFFAMDTSNSDNYRPGDWHIRKIASLTQSQGGVECVNLSKLLADGNFKLAQIDGSTYTIECQIPFNTLKETSSFDGKFFRFDIMVNDNDGSGWNRTGQLFWNSDADDEWTKIYSHGLIEMGSMQSIALDLSKNLVIYWPFNGNVKDSSINNYATTNNNATYTTDRFGKANSALYCNGTDAYVVTTSKLDITATNFTYNVWFKTQNSGLIFNSSAQTSLPMGYGSNRIYLNDQGNIVVGIWSMTDGQSHCIKSPLKYNDNVWHNVAYVQNDTATILYIDNKFIGYNKTTSPFYEPNHWAVGYTYVDAAWLENPTNCFFKGSIDEVRLYNRALTVQEINALYTNSLGNYKLIVENKVVNKNVDLSVAVSTSKIATSENIISYQFDLAYDTSFVTYTGNSVLNSLSSGGTLISNEVSPGNLKISFASTTALSGEGDLLFLKFRSKKNGVSPVIVTNVIFDTLLFTGIKNGQITVDATKPTGNISISKSGVINAGSTIVFTCKFSEPMSKATPIGIPKIVLSGANTLDSANLVYVSDSVYNYTYTVKNGNGIVNISLKGNDIVGNAVVSIPTGTSSFTITSLKLGDVDENEKIQAFDAALVLQYSVGLDPIPAIDAIPWEDWRIKAANVDNVANVSANDASLILQYTVGLISVFPSSLKAATVNNASVAISIEDNYVIFRSVGDLVGLNVYVESNVEMLGNVESINTNILSAVNITSDTYSIGLAAAQPISENQTLMKIPLKASSGKVVFNLNVNSEVLTKTLDISTQVSSAHSSNIIVYPNPATDVIYISNLTSTKSVVELYNTDGKLVLSKKIDKASNSLNVSNIQAGMYIVKVYDGTNYNVQKLILK